MPEEIPDQNTVSPEDENHGEGQSRSHHHHHRRPSSARRRSSLSSVKHHKDRKKEPVLTEEDTPTGRYKFKFEQQSKVDSWRKIESNLTRHFLKILGVIFLLNGIWFILSSSTYLRKFLTLVFDQVVAKGVTEAAVSAPAAPVSPAPFFDWMLLVFGAIAMAVFILFRISVRKKSFELEVIAFLSWSLLAVWWIVRFALGSNTLLIIGYLMVSTLFFAAIYYANMLNVFSLRRTLIRRMEAVLIFLNFLFYFLTGIVSLKLLHLAFLMPVFALVLSAGSFYPVYKAARRRDYYNRIPYMTAIALIASFILPLAIPVNPAILYLASLSVLLLLISRATHHQFSVILSIGSMLALIMIFLFQWIFEYIPGAFVNNILSNPFLFIKGLVAGIAIIPVFIINNKLLKRLTISISKKVFDRGTYRKVIKGVVLGVFFLTGFWVFNFLLQYILKLNGLTYLFLFSYTCLYFTVLIPYLYRTNSSFTRMIIYLAAGLILFYPSLIHAFNLNFRLDFLQGNFLLVSGFAYHYLNVVLLFVLLLVILKYKTRAFARKKNIIRGFWVYFCLMVYFIVVSEFHHLVFFAERRFTGLAPDRFDRMLNLVDSILLMAVTVVFLVMGFLQRFRFLRVFSLIMIACILIKVITLDIYTLDNTIRIVVFIVMGSMAFGLSLFYSRVKRFFFSHDGHSRDGETSEEPETIETE